MRSTVFEGLPHAKAERLEQLGIPVIARRRYGLGQHEFSLAAENGVRSGHEAQGLGRVVEFDPTCGQANI